MKKLNMRRVVHYCQKCLGANPLGAEHCARCGTRLMLVVEPPTARFDAGSFDTSHEEHLLERVSALENRLSRLASKLEQGLGLVLKHARNTYFDHTLIQTLIGALNEAGTINAEAVYALWRERCEDDARAQERKDKQQEQLREQLLKAYQGPDVAVFSRYVDVAISFLEQGDAVRAIRSLERAAAMSPNNAALFSFIGRYYFEVGKMPLVIAYLERAYNLAPEAEGVPLLLGLAYADNGDAKLARKMLNEASRHGPLSSAAYYGLGLLLATEQKWSGALAEFKRALKARPSPEAHYVIGCVYYQMNRDRLATRHLLKAIELDGKYAEAFYMLGLVYLRAGEGERADEAFAAARALDADDPRYRPKTLRRLARSGDIPASPLVFYAARHMGQKLLMGGDQRLAAVIRADALSAVKAGQH
jgi:tetratricopeptide (TPR) repeat protein